jgi:serine/threonine-protein kinase RsbW
VQSPGSGDCLAAAREPSSTSVPEFAHVSLNLSNKAENVLLVRQALSGLAETIGLDAVELNDISTAVSEACNNVVVHAYAGAEGPLEVEVFAGDEPLEVIVRDHGGGITPHERDPDEMVGGIGLPVIRALSDTASFRDLDGGGTEVCMAFVTAGASALPPLHGNDADTAAPARQASPDTTAVTIGPASLARTVLPRILCALAARAHFSTDRISDTQLLSDALVAHAEDSINGGRLAVEISVAPRDLQLRVGPLPSGFAEQVLEHAAIDGLGSVLERLTDGHEISGRGSAEVLDLHLTAQR